MKNGMKIIVWIITLIMLLLNITKSTDIPWLVVFAPVLIWYSIWIFCITIIIIALALYGVGLNKKDKRNE